MTLSNTSENKSTRNKHTVKNDGYIVKRVFLGNKELKDIIWTIAENKAIREMGLAN